MRPRVIPCLLLSNGGLVKSIKFRNHTYVGDPINAVKIFNDKEADEIAIIDIGASAAQRGPDMALISEVVSEAFMPVAYGGGVRHMQHLESLFYMGVEKVIVNKAAHTNTGLISEAAQQFGSQSIIVSIDVKKTMLKGYRVFTENGLHDTREEPADFAKRMEQLGAGEILLNSIERDGTYRGYDEQLINKVAHAVDIPVIAVGGAASVSDFRKAMRSGASAVSAGSMFVFKRPHRAVLISYPTQSEIKELIDIQS